MELSETIHGFARATMALFIIIDPIGLLPVVMALTSGQDVLHRQRMLYQSAGVAFLLMLLLTFSTKAIFGLYDIEIADFQIAGGLILLLVAIHTINQRHWDEGYGGQGAGIVPIACPLLVGPGAIVTSIIYLNRYGAWVSVAAIAAAFLLTYLVFRFTGALFRLLGATGAGVVARLMGMLLAAIAIQFIRQGVLHFLRPG